MPSQSGEIEGPGSPANPERGARTSLGPAMVLGCVGGLLDAFLYIDHGGVFAGAMTGNVVLCGIALLSHNGATIWHHALPILAFLCGASLAEVLQGRLTHHSATIALGAEIVGLLFASLLPHSFPDELYVFLIALLAAFQTASFRKADQYSYNSTFITGDLRTFVFGVCKAFDPEHRSEGIGQAREIGLIVAAFIAGAAVGAVLSPRLGNHTLWVACAALLIAFGFVLRRSLTGETRRRHQRYEQYDLPLRPEESQKH